MQSHLTQVLHGRLLAKVMKAGIERPQADTRHRGQLGRCQGLMSVFLDVLFDPFDMARSQTPVALMKLIGVGMGLNRQQGIDDELLGLRGEQWLSGGLGRLMQQPGDVGDQVVPTGLVPPTERRMKA